MFVDDRAGNVAPPRGLGIRAIHHTTPATTREALRAAGVRI